MNPEAYTQPLIEAVGAAESGPEDLVFEEFEERVEPSVSCGSSCSCSCTSCCCIWTF